MAAATIPPPFWPTQFQLRPDVTRVVLLNGNYGQHMAIMAGFEATRGDITVTLDADLQNPPEEIGNLVAKMREGYDYVGSDPAQAAGLCMAHLCVQGDEPPAPENHAYQDHRPGQYAARLQPQRDRSDQSVH